MREKIPARGHGYWRLLTKPADEHYCPLDCERSIFISFTLRCAGRPFPFNVCLRPNEPSRCQWRRSLYGQVQSKLIVPLTEHFNLHHTICRAFGWRSVLERSQPRDVWLVVLILQPQPFHTCMASCQQFVNNYGRLELLPGLAINRRTLLIRIIMQSLAGSFSRIEIPKYRGNCKFLIHRVISVFVIPAGLGRWQVAKEIGHNLARERPKFGHNLVRGRPTHNLAQFRARMTKIRSQSSTWTKRGLGTIMWAIDENTGTNLQAFYKHFYTTVWKHKNSNYILY